MKEKDIKKLKTKTLNVVSGETHIEANESALYRITLENPEIEESKIYLHIRKPQITANFQIRIVLSKEIRATLFVCVVAHLGAKGASSELDMKALFLNENASLTFVPSLEIDELDVSVDHKSSVGKPPVEWVRFLQSRGFSSEEIEIIARDIFLTN